MNGRAARTMQDEAFWQQVCPAEVARRLPTGYASRSAQDTRRPRCLGRPLSSDVCQLAVHVAERAGCARIIVLGWGAAEAFRSLRPEFDLVVVDREDARSLLGWDVPRAAFIVGDLEAGLPPLDRATLEGSLVVCLGVLEQLARPEILARDLARIRHRCAFLLVATPDRARLRGLMDGGPPIEPDRVREWTADEFGRFLVDCGFPANLFLGHAAVSRDDHAKDIVLAIAGREAELSCSGRKLRVADIINTFNEADIIEHVVRYVVGQGLEVHLVDNWSDDGTYEICCQLHAAGCCDSVSRFPEQPTNSFQLFEQLQNTCRLAVNLNADWVVHYDADEIREAPRNGVSLAEAIEFIDALGYSAIDFTIVNFLFVEGQCERSLFHVDDFRWFDFGRHPGHFTQIKAWRNAGQHVDLASSGGHSADFRDRRTYPLKFLTKHYPLRSRRQAERKIFRDRLPRMEREAMERGRHNHYDIYRHLNAMEGWRRLDLMSFAKCNFYSEFLVERLSGVGVDQEPRAIPSTNQAFRLADALAALQEQATPSDQAGDRVAEQELASARAQLESPPLQGRAGLRATMPLRQIAAACRRMRRLVTSASRQGAR